MKVPFPVEGNLYSIDDLEGIVKLMTGKYGRRSKWAPIEEFEAEFARYVGSSYAISTSNCTTALHLALKAAGVKRGDEVITTPITWVATSNVILEIGAKPVFSDINSDTLNLDHSLIEEKITKKTKAILPVYFAGNPVDIREFSRIAKKANLALIADAAHAAGAEYNVSKIGSCTFEDFVCFSFHTQKNMSTLGEGGMVTTNSKDSFDMMRAYANNGIVYSDIASGCKMPAWYKNCIGLGYNYRLSEGQSVVGISQLKKLDAMNEKRNLLANAYAQNLMGIQGIKLPKTTGGSISSWHLYVIQVEKDFGISRDELYEKLNNEGVGSNVHYTPVYYYKPYKDRGYKKGICPRAEEAYEKILSLPLSPKMSIDDVCFVSETLRRIQRK